MSNKKTETNAYLKSLRELKEARVAYENAVVKHLKARLTLRKTEIKEKILTQIRDDVYNSLLKIESNNLSFLDGEEK